MQALHKYSKYVWLGLLVQVIAAWFSIGYHHPDEHFQVLEFAGYKLGLYSAADLPWEFAARIRPALQPFIAYGISKILFWLGLFNPFTVAFLLRLLMGVFTWWITCRVLAMVLHELVTGAAKKILIWCSFLLWFVPYVGVRFSAENISGLLFLLSLTLVLPVGEAGQSRRPVMFIIAGFLLGLSLVLRIQMLFALVPLVAWLLRYRKWSLSQWVYICTGTIPAIGLSVCIDYWFYGAWLFTPWNYFQANVVHHVAASYGVYPAWFYFTEFINIAVPPLSIALLLCFVYGLWNKRENVFSWIAISFIIGHSIPAHKEIRFLFPVMLPFIIIACCGIDALITGYVRKGRALPRWLTIVLKSFAVINCTVLLIKIFTPAAESVSYLQSVFNYAKTQEVVLVAAGKSPYWLNELNANFYKCPNVHLQIVEREEQIDSVINNHGKWPVLFLSRNLSGDPLLQKYPVQRVFCLIPAWASYFNFFDWESRSNLWTLYRIE